MFINQVSIASDNNFGIAKVDQDKLSVDSKGTVSLKSNEFECTGAPETFIVPQDGVYLLEVQGAQGSPNETQTITIDGQDYEFEGGYGGYSKGYVELKRGTKLSVVVGGICNLIPVPDNIFHFYERNIRGDREETFSYTAPKNGTLIASINLLDRGSEIYINDILQDCFQESDYGNNRNVVAKFPLSKDDKFDLILSFYSSGSADVNLQFVPCEDMGIIEIYSKQDYEYSYEPEIEISDNFNYTFPSKGKLIITSCSYVNTLSATVDGVACPLEIIDNEQDSDYNMYSLNAYVDVNEGSELNFSYLGQMNYTNTNTKIYFIPGSIGTYNNGEDINTTGGGATHIALGEGKELYEYGSDQDAESVVLITAAGGGGVQGPNPLSDQLDVCTGGNGGGIKGGDGIALHYGGKGIEYLDFAEGGEYTTLPVLHNQEGTAVSLASIPNYNNQAIEFYNTEYEFYNSNPPRPKTTIEIPLPESVDRNWRDGCVLELLDATTGEFSGDKLIQQQMVDQCVIEEYSYFSRFLMQLILRHSDNTEDIIRNSSTAVTGELGTYSNFLEFHICGIHDVFYDEDKFPPQGEKCIGVVLLKLQNYVPVTDDPIKMNGSLGGAGVPYSWFTDNGYLPPDIDRQTEPEVLTKAVNGEGGSQINGGKVYSAGSFGKGGLG